jgi:hypothetical protein
MELGELQPRYNLAVNGHKPGFYKTGLSMYTLYQSKEHLTDA